jgi:hypothetical protein
MHTPEFEDDFRDCRVSYDLLGGTGCILDELKRRVAAERHIQKNCYQIDGAISFCAPKVNSQ